MISASTVWGAMARTKSAKYTKILLRSPKNVRDRDRERGDSARSFYQGLFLMAHLNNTLTSAGKKRVKIIERDEWDEKSAWIGNDLIMLESMVKLYNTVDHAKLAHAKQHTSSIGVEGEELSLEVDVILEVSPSLIDVPVYAIVTAGEHTGCLLELQSLRCPMSGKQSIRGTVSSHSLGITQLNSVKY